jgi:putative membrane protein
VARFYQALSIGVHRREKRIQFRRASRNRHFKEISVMGEIDRLFSQQDLEAVRAAVEAAEGKTAGELVPYVVESSDTYEGALWKGAVFGALLLTAAALAVRQFTEIWGVVGPWWISLPPVAGAAAGYWLAALVPAVKRALVSADVIDTRVRRRAAVAFLDEEVFDTSERTGILLFLSLFEHRVVVLGDSGINAKVEQEEWEAIVAGMVAAIREGRPAAALVEALGKCGVLLERRGVAIRPDDSDELSDELRTRES